jgi:Tol biopolymer transport system component
MTIRLRLSALALAWILVSGLASAQTTERASVGAAGAQGDQSGFGVSVSASGRYVAFASNSTNLVAGDSNGNWDVFVRDRLGATTERVSVDSAGLEGNGLSDTPSISADGRLVAFCSAASNLVPGDTNGLSDVFVHDRLNGITQRVSISSAGLQASDQSSACSISADGRFVVFASVAPNLVAGDTNAAPDIFVRDLQSATTERVDIAWSGAQANSSSFTPSISADGRCVAFMSTASNLVSNDQNQLSDIFLRDRQAGTTTRVSTNTSGGSADGASFACAISADARCVAFFSFASNLVAGDTDGFGDLFLRDLQLGTTELLSVDSAGAQANLESEQIAPALSADGRRVAFSSRAWNLVAGDTNGQADVFLRDRHDGTTERLSLSSFGAQGDHGSFSSALSADGRFAGFTSAATNLVAADTNAATDIFVRDRLTPGLGSDLCQPGAAAVLDCPCFNPPVSAPRGCENSSLTGGARLFAQGQASLGADTVEFLTFGEKPSATSILLQGDALIPNGLVFGQGVRCAGGTLKRLYTKIAVGGSIQAPAAGEASVSSRSAALGDTLVLGSSRWYAVYYRDPIVLDFCPASSTFNITQTERIDWGS